MLTKTVPVAAGRGQGVGHDPTRVRVATEEFEGQFHYCATLKDMKCVVYIFLSLKKNKMIFTAASSMG